MANANAASLCRVPHFAGMMHVAASPTSAIASTTKPIQLSDSGDVTERRKVPIERDVLLRSQPYNIQKMMTQ